MDVLNDYITIIDGLTDRLESLRDAGVAFIPRIVAPVSEDCAAREGAESCCEAAILFVRDASDLDVNGLTRMIEAMGFKSEDVRIVYAGADGDQRLPRLDTEIKKVSPKVIVTLGPKAASSLLGSEDVAGLRGRFHEYKGFKVMPSYDPASIVGKEDLRQKTWADMKLVMKELGADGQKVR